MRIHIKTYNQILCYRLYKVKYAKKKSQANGTKFRFKQVSVPLVFCLLYCGILATPKYEQFSLTEEVRYKQIPF